MPGYREGWVWRQTFVLKRWKLNWCEITRDGTLSFYSGPNNPQKLEHRLHLKKVCVDVSSGLECRDLTPPADKLLEDCVVLNCIDGTVLKLCARNRMDAYEWRVKFLQNRRSPRITYDPYDDYYYSSSSAAYSLIYVPATAMPSDEEDEEERELRIFIKGITDSLYLGLFAGVVAGTIMKFLLWLPGSM